MSKNVISMGIECPIVREGDDIVNIVIENVLKHQIDNYDVIGITESVVARSNGLYVSVDEIAEDITKKFGKDQTITLICPIYSRNRFSMILKGIARSAKKIVCIMPEYDEVGNPKGVNPFTGVNIEKYYKEICENENCEFDVQESLSFTSNWKDGNWIDCHLHNYTRHTGENKHYSLADICADKNPDFGLLGTNKATEERLKLFPTKELADRVCNEVKEGIKERTGKDVIVMTYGDGSYKDIDVGIWEMADPVSSPGYTDKGLLDRTPYEIKLKYFADLGYTDKEIQDEIFRKNLMGDLGRCKMQTQGTTPRRYVNLLASLMDLTTGSGERATPVVLVKNYF